MKQVLFFLAGLAFTFNGLAQDGGVQRNFAIKFTPTQLMAGEFNLSYEQRLSSFVSLELSFGPAFSEVGVNRSNHKLWHNNDLDNSDLDISSNMGFHVGLEPRFYLLYDENEMRGLYLAPQLKYRVYNSEYAYKDMNNTKGSLSQFICRFNLGYQFWPGANKFCMDVFTGFGFGSVDDTYYTPLQVYNSTTMNYDYTWSEHHNKTMSLNLVVGLKLGFGK